MLRCHYEAVRNRLRESCWVSGLLGLAVSRSRGGDVFILVHSAIPFNRAPSPPGLFRGEKVAKPDEGGAANTTSTLFARSYPRQSVTSRVSIKGSARRETPSSGLRPPSPPQKTVGEKALDGRVPSTDAKPRDYATQQPTTPPTPPLAPHLPVGRRKILARIRCRGRACGQPGRRSRGLPPSRPCRGCGRGC
ncbi:MAG: hypothetical protein QOC81_1630 [Thermoanaerobaculia bacterium]|nr:hypothetical protein [Thermoanaerobaculia bacterium]